MLIYNKKNLVIFCNHVWLESIALESLSENKFKKVLMVTDKKILISKISKNINVLVTKKLSTNWIKNNIDYENSLLISFGSPWIFSQKIIDLFANQLLNVHQSPLPKYKGSIASYALLFRLKALQSWIHIVKKEIDSGSLIYNNDIFLDSTLDTPEKINNHIQFQNRKMIRKFLDDYINNVKFNITNQNNIFNSYLPRLNTEINGWIDWSLNVHELDRFIRSFDKPYNGARTFLNGKEVTIKDIDFSLEDASLHSFSNGMVLRKFKERLVVSVNSGSLYIKEVKLNNQNIAMKIKNGDKFNTPFKYIDISKNRVLYSKKDNKIFNRKYKIKNSI